MWSPPQDAGLGERRRSVEQIEACGCQLLQALRCGLVRFARFSVLPCCPPAAASQLSFLSLSLPHSPSHAAPLLDAHSQHCFSHSLSTAVCILAYSPCRPRRLLQHFPASHCSASRTALDSTHWTMANWIGGRLAVVNHAARDETERERRRAEDSRRRRAVERREEEDEEDRGREPQHRGALLRAIQAVEQQQQPVKRKRARRGGEETAMMDRLRTTDNRAADERRRGRGRGRSRERADSRERTVRRRGRAEGGERARARRETGHREEYDGVEDRYTETRPRLTRQRAEVVDESWDGTNYTQPRERYSGQRRRGDVEQCYEVRVSQC